MRFMSMTRNDGSMVADAAAPVAATSRAGAALWIALVSGSSILFSLALACAMPFAALATVAGARLERRTAFALVGFAWLANQAIGYLVLGYPRTWDSFAWGLAIGVAAFLALGAVFAVRHRMRSGIGVLIVGFVAAFLAYEVALYAATAFLPSGDEAFSLPVVAEIFWTNAVALAGLLVLHRIAVAAGLLATEPGARRAAGHI